MALRKDAGDLGWTKDDEKKKKLKPKAGKPRKPGLSPNEIAKQVQKQDKRVQQQRQSMEPPKQPGKVSSLDPFYKIVEANGQLEINDIRYLRKLAWTTKNKDTPDELRAGIDAARQFFEDNPEMKRVAGIKYQDFHGEGKTRDTKWYRAMMASLEADKAAGEGQKYLAENAGKLSRIPEGTDLGRTSDESIAPAIAPEYSAADLTPERADAIVKALVNTTKAAGLSEAESEKLFDPENIVKIENVTDFDGQGPGFIVHYSDGINKSKQAVLWRQVPKRHLPGGLMEPAAAPATGSGKPLDQRMDMLNDAWREVYKDTQVGRFIPDSIMPALLASGIEIKNKDAAIKLFQSLRDPYLIDPRNPYAMNPDTFWQVQGKLQDSFTANTNDIPGEPLDVGTMYEDQDPTAMQGLLTPFEGEGFTNNAPRGDERNPSDQVFWGETHDNMLRLNDIVVISVAKEYTQLPQMVSKAGQVMSFANQNLAEGETPLTMIDVFEQWTGVKSPDGTITIEMEEAIRHKVYLSALMRSLADPKDVEANTYLSTEHGLPMVEGSVAKAFLDQYLPEIITYTPEQMKDWTAEDREFALAEQAKPREQRYQELATRLAVESKLPFESDASAVYKLYKIDPEYVTAEYKQLFDIAHESVEKEYAVLFGEKGAARPVVPIDRHVTHERTAPRMVTNFKNLPKGSQESIVYAAINMAEVDLYAEEEPEAPRAVRGAKGAYKASPEGFQKEGSALSDVEQGWNFLFHHPVATMLEAGQVQQGKHVVETGQLPGGGKGKVGTAGSERAQERKQGLVDQYTQYLTTQRIANPDMSDDDFGSTWTILSGTWSQLKRRGNGYINMGTYTMQEMDPNYQKGDNLLAEFAFDMAYEFALFAPMGSAFKTAKTALKLSDVFRAKRALFYTKIGQETVGDFAVQCDDAFVFMDRWHIDPYNAGQLERAKSLKEVNEIYEGLSPLLQLKFDPGAWDVPLRSRLAFKAKMVQHPALDRFFSVSGTHTISGGNFPLDHRAARDGFERAYAAGLSYDEAQKVGNILSRMLAGDISGEGALRLHPAFSEVYEETVLRSLQRAMMSRRGAIDAAGGKVPKGLQKRADYINKLSDEIVILEQKNRHWAADIDALRRGAKDTADAESQLARSQAQLQAKRELRDKVGGHGSYRPAPPTRPMTDMEKKLGQRIFTDAERADMRHNIRVMFDDLEDLTRARNQRIKNNDSWREARFKKENPGKKGAWWDEMVRTASREAVDPEGNLVPEMLTDKFVLENGFISDDRLSMWWRDKVRPITKRETEKMKGREPGQIYGPKQGGEAVQDARPHNLRPDETSKTVGPREAYEISRARTRLRREERLLRKALHRIAPRHEKSFNDWTQKLLVSAGLKEEDAFIAAQRLLMTNVAREAGVPVHSLHGLGDEFLKIVRDLEFGDEVAEGLSKHWDSIADDMAKEFVAPRVPVGGVPRPAPVDPVELAVEREALKATLKSKRRRADSAQKMAHYGSLGRKELDEELFDILGYDCLKIADDMKINVHFLTRDKWPAGVGQTDAEGNVISRAVTHRKGPEDRYPKIYIDRDQLAEDFERKVWTTWSATKLPAETFQTVDDYHAFAVYHELAHAKRPKGPNQLTGKALEDAMNKEALEMMVRSREAAAGTAGPIKVGDTIKFRAWDEFGDPYTETGIVDSIDAGKFPTAHVRMENGAMAKVTPDDFGNEVVYRPATATTPAAGPEDFIDRAYTGTTNMGPNAGWERNSVVFNLEPDPRGGVQLTTIRRLDDAPKGAGAAEIERLKALSDETGTEIWVGAEAYDPKGMFAGKKSDHVAYYKNLGFEPVDVRGGVPQMVYRPRVTQPVTPPPLVDPADTARRLQIVKRIQSQRSANSKAIEDFRGELKTINDLISASESATPEGILAGNVGQRALGNFEETAQPLIPSQMQQMYQPPVDPRLDMIWRSGKGARLLEEFNTHPRFFLGVTSMDRASNIFKVAILARVATAIRIVLADEFTRLLPEGINPIQAKIYLKEMIEYDAKYGAKYGHRVLPPEVRADLKSIYGIVRKSSYMPLDPGDPDFIAAYSGMLSQWNGDPVVQMWKRAYMASGGGEDGIVAAKEVLRAAAHNPDSIVAAHLRLTNRYWGANLSIEDIYGALGAKNHMAKLRTAFEGKNVDDWVDVASEQFAFFSQNRYTAQHFIGDASGKVVKPKSKHFKGLQGTFGKGYDAPPIVVGRMNFGDVGRHKWLPQVMFGDVLESISSSLNEMVYAHMYVTHRTGALAGMAGEMAGKLPKGVDVSDIWEAHKWLDPDTIKQIESMSAQYAESMTTKIMYTAGTSAGEDVLRNIILFLPAQRQYLLYWAKALFENPVMLAYFHRLNAMPDYVEFRGPWNREGEHSKLYIRGLLFATPGFVDDPLASKAYQMMPGLGLPGVILGAGVGLADLAGWEEPKEAAMKLPQGDYYKDTWRPLNTSLTQLSYGLSTLALGRPDNVLPEQVVGDNATNLWKFAEVIKAQVARVLKGDSKGRVDMTQMPDLERGLGNWNEARTHGLQALVSAGWNFIVPVKFSIVDSDAQEYLDLSSEWNSLETYGDRSDFLARNRTSNFAKVIQIEMSTSEMDRQRLLYNNPELMPYYVSNVGFIAPEGEEYDFENVVDSSKKLFMSKMDTERSLQLRKELEAEELWFDKVYMPALRKREPWTGSNTTLSGPSAAYTPDSPSNLIRVRKDWENSTGAFAGEGLTDKQGNTHTGLGNLRAEIGGGAYLSKSDFASDPDSSIYQATEMLFESRAGARFVRTSKNYDAFTDLYRISHKEGEEEAILAAMQPFTQMSNLERASVFGKKWGQDEEWIMQRVAGVWDHYEEGYKKWLKKTDKDGNHPNAGKDHGDFRYTDYGEALYAAVTNEVYKHLASPDASKVLAGGMAQQMLYTPLVRPHLVVYLNPEKDRKPSDPITDIERLLDRTTGMGNQPGHHGGALSDIPERLPKWDESGTRKVKYGEKALPERLLPGIMASVVLSAKIKTGEGGTLWLAWDKANRAQLKSEDEYLKTYMKTADPVTKYNIREAQRAFTWELFLKSMAATTRDAWGYRSEYQKWNSGYRGRNSSETDTAKYIKKLEKKFLPAFFDASPLFKKEWEYYNEKAGGNLIADMINTYR